MEQQPEFFFLGSLSPPPPLPTEPLSRCTCLGFAAVIICGMLSRRTSTTFSAVGDVAADADGDNSALPFCCCGDCAPPSASSCPVVVPGGRSPLSRPSFHSLRSSSASWLISPSGRNGLSQPS